jgi:histidyl-tRNA synthetase
MSSYEKRIEVDLRESVKLKEKLNYLMNTKNSGKILIIGSQELKDNTISIKENNKGMSTIRLDELDKLL